ncbi:LysR family transcriptional regulator [Pseudomonas putida S11]|nr:LysR family transcriptional regulator [Pseudomonas putida S11]
MTSIRQLRYFVEIAECGSFSAAAERLYIAQSALSRQIKELEQQLGTPLFERTARLPRLTLAGQAFLERARRLLADLAQAERVTRDIGEGLQGSLRLNHSSTVPLTGPLLARLGGYLRDNPGVSLEIAQQSSEAQLEDIAAGRLDIGLLRLPVLRQHEGVVLHELFSEPLLLAVAAAHPLARAPQVKPGTTAGRALHFHSAPGPWRAELPVGLDVHGGRLFPASSAGAVAQDHPVAVDSGGVWGGVVAGMHA